ncbi:hypothetical protein LXL04_012805 [Taraxacum kok-saghyz]
MDIEYSYELHYHLLWSRCAMGFPESMAVIPVCTVILLLTESAGGVKHIVGGSIWSIPPSTHFYTNWSSSQTFFTGDFLYFDFESGMYDFMYCESNDEFVPQFVFDEGPALIPLETEGYKMFICRMLDYCPKGMKFEVLVNRRRKTGSKMIERTENPDSIDDISPIKVTVFLLKLHTYTLIFPESGAQWGRTTAIGFQKQQQ